MKILITGASGFIGHHLTKRLWTQQFEIYPVFREHSITDCCAQCCDLRDIESVRKMLGRLKPDVIVHCAASSNVEECQKNKMKSWETNVISTLNLIRAIKNRTHFVYLSTAEVFDGILGGYSEDSVRNPINWYGHTKVACEDIVTNMVPAYTVVRLSYQYGYDTKGTNFVHKSLEKLIMDQPVYATDDLICSPTYVGTTASAIEEIIDNNMEGIFNIADRESLTKYQLVSNLAIKLDKSALVHPEKSNTVFEAERPKDTSLNVSKFSRQFNNARPLSVQEALVDFHADFKN